MQVKTERISWIDIARGIGIILVIYGHGLNAESVRHLIYAFHMPLFFFLSGIVYHHRTYPRFTAFIQKSIKSILLPYLLFTSLSYLIWMVNRDPHLVSLDQFKHHALQMLYANGNNGGLFFNVVLWFLPCLFITKITFAFITQKISNPRWIAAILFLFSLVGYASSVFFKGVKLPFGIETALTAIVFFGLGYLWNTKKTAMKKILSRHAHLLFILGTLLVIIIGSIQFRVFGSQVDMLQNKYHNYFLFYAGALSGISATIALSTLIKKNVVLENIGKNSLVLFIWHMIVFTHFNQILRIFLDAQTMQHIRNTMIAPLYTIGSILLILFITMVYKKIKPFHLLAIPAKKLLTSH